MTLTPLSHSNSTSQAHCPDGVRVNRKLENRRRSRLSCAGVIAGVSVESLTCGTVGVIGGGLDGCFKRAGQRGSATLDTIDDDFRNVCSGTAL